MFKLDHMESNETMSKRSYANRNIVLEKYRKSLKFGKGDKFIREVEIKMIDYLIQRRLKDSKGRFKFSY